MYRLDRGCDASVVDQCLTKDNDIVWKIRGSAFMQHSRDSPSKEIQTSDPIFSHLSTSWALLRFNHVRLYDYVS
jgi:hypothetical protein